MTLPDPAVRPGSDPDAPPPPASLRQVIGTVFWSFFGIRKRAHMRRDLGSIRPHQVIIVGIVFAAIFVVTLLTLVNIIVRSH